MSASGPKKVAKKTSAAPVTESPAVAVAAPAAEVPKKVSKKASAAAEPVAAPVVAAPVAATPEVAPAADAAAAEPTFEQELAEVQRQLETVRASATAALAALKRVAKRHAAEVKDARKNRRAKKAATEGDSSAPRKPNNFEIPVAISDELSAFFGGGKNNTMSRSEVNKAMSAYIKSHGLGQGQQINPDAALRKLLSVGADDKVTIFNIQKYLARHYPKVAKA
jgi:chromatin remodeling complex protein RSC6